MDCVRSKSKRWTPILCWVGICAMIVLMANVVLKDLREALAADHQQELNVEKYVHIERVGIARGSWAYIATDKAGNKWFLNDKIVFPIKDAP